MQFPTVDPESEWTQSQIATGCRIVGARVDGDDRSKAWLELQFHKDAKYMIVEPDLAITDPDAVP